MKSVRKAYLLWLLSGFGWLGLHRFYLEKSKTATIWIFTLGFFGIGTIADLFLLKWLVDRYNIIERIKNFHAELNKTKEIKERFVQEQKYEEAARQRDKEVVLMKKIGVLKQKLMIKGR